MPRRELSFQPTLGTLQAVIGKASDKEYSVTL